MSKSVQPPNSMRRFRNWSIKIHHNFLLSLRPRVLFPFRLQYRHSSRKTSVFLSNYIQSEKYRKLWIFFPKLVVPSLIMILKFSVFVKNVRKGLWWCNFIKNLSGTQSLRKVEKSSKTLLVLGGLPSQKLTQTSKSERNCAWNSPYQLKRVRS